MASADTLGLAQKLPKDHHSKAVIRLWLCSLVLKTALAEEITHRIWRDTTLSSETLLVGPVNRSIELFDYRFLFVNDESLPRAVLCKKLDEPH